MSRQYPTFAKWINRVDELLIESFGLGHKDLPDALWTDWFGEGLSPGEALDCYQEGGWNG